MVALGIQGSLNSSPGDRVRGPPWRLTVFQIFQQQVPPFLAVSPGGNSMIWKQI
jgi:hypothetical protein